jgi:hypothetical protein
MEKLNRHTVEEAFRIMGEHLRDRRVMGEIVIYGGTALMLQFEWRSSTEDVDAVITSSDNHGEVQRAVHHAAKRLGLPMSWLNESVSSYASRHEKPTDRIPMGIYPDYNRPALRVLVAGARYMLAMKIAAVRRRTWSDKDFSDVVSLSAELDIGDYQAFADIYADFYPDEKIPTETALRLHRLIAERSAAKQVTRP